MTSPIPFSAVFVPSKAGGGEITVAEGFRVNNNPTRIPLPRGVCFIDAVYDGPEEITLKINLPGFPVIGTIRAGAAGEKRRMGLQQVPVPTQGQYLLIIATITQATVDAGRSIGVTVSALGPQ